MSIWQKWVTHGIADAAAALGRRYDAIDLGSLAVVLKYAWLHSLGAVHPNRSAGKPPAVPTVMPRAERERMLEHALELLGMPADKTLRASLMSDIYWHRLHVLVYEHLLSERTAPELRLYPDGTVPDWRIALPERPVFVVFEQAVNFTNELYTLAIDALVAASGRARATASPLIGVHASWLTEDCCALRGIVCVRQGDLLVEVPLASIQPQAIFVLCAGTDTHHLVAQRALATGVPCLNEYEDASEVLDNKSECAKRWDAAGIRTPRCLLLDLESAGAVKELLRMFRREVGDRLVIQPNRGTEGNLVGVFDVSVEEALEAGVQHVRTILSEGEEAIVRPYVEGLGIRSARDKQSSFDLRINVQFDGKTHLAESGFLQISDPFDGTFSMHTGARYSRLSKGLVGGFTVPDANRPFSPNKEFWREICLFAENAARALPPVAMVGIDIRIVIIENGRHVPVALDANPRPSGFTHSEFLPNGSHAGMPGVSIHLWKDLRLLAT